MKFVSFFFFFLIKYDLFLLNKKYRQAVSNLGQRTTSIISSPIQNYPKDLNQNKRTSQVFYLDKIVFRKKFFVFFLHKIDVNVSPHVDETNELKLQAPEIRKYKKRFNCDILCAALWGLFYLFIYSFLLILF